jgi:hypothetical protein
MAGRGGARPGAGRPTIAQELATADLAREVLIKRFGSLQEALNAFLEKNNPILDKFVLEHAFGKPTDNLNLSGGLTNTTEYDLSKLSSQALKELLNAATTDKPSEGGTM